MRHQLEIDLRDINQKKGPERYETVRAFELSHYVASLSSVSRYLVFPPYPTVVTPLSIAGSGV